MNQFFTWDDFVENYGAEMRIAGEVYEGLTENGLKENCLCKFDFTFVSNRKENLQRLAEVLTQRYAYTVAEIEAVEEAWELNGETREIPVTEDNLLYWALDMAKRGYEFDAKFEAYGAPFDPREQRFPDLDASKEDFWFDQAIELYEAGNLSGALIGWSNVIAINPRNSDAFYSRAIVKNELYTWKSALRDYDAALQIDPEDFRALVNRGSLKADHDDHQGAMQDFDAVIQLASDDPSNKAMAYFNRGNSKLALHDNAGACADWKQAQALGAEYASARIAEHCSH
jgi:tetratricopeptide (TPR) repeat protein